MKEILEQNPEILDLIDEDSDTAAVFLCFEAGESRKIVADLCWGNFLTGPLISTVFNIVCKENPSRFIALLEGDWETFSKAVRREPEANQKFGEAGHPLASEAALAPYYHNLFERIRLEQKILQKVKKLPPGFGLTIGLKIQGND